MGVTVNFITSNLQKKKSISFYANINITDITWIFLEYLTNFQIKKNTSEKSDHLKIFPQNIYKFEMIKSENLGKIKS